MGCFGGGDINVPGPTAQEVELQQMQLNEMRRQNKLNEQFQPFILESLGFKIEGDGSVTKIEQPKDELTQLYEERQLQAMKGELPISPAMEKELSQQQSSLMENLSQRLGPDWQQTTAGQQSMSEFQKRAELLREEARRGQITTGEGLLESRMGFLQGMQQTDLSNLSAFSAPNSAGAYTSALAPYQMQRQMQFSANQSDAANSTSLLSGLMGMVGTGVGAYAGAGGTFGAGKQKMSSLTIR
jgi:hypothetical protein